MEGTCICLYVKKQVQFTLNANTINQVWVQEGWILAKFQSSGLIWSHGPSWKRYFRNFCGFAAGIPETLAFTRPSSAQLCFPLLADITIKIPLYPKSHYFRQTSEVDAFLAIKMSCGYNLPISFFKCVNSQLPLSRLKLSMNWSVTWKNNEYPVLDLRPKLSDFLYPIPVYCLKTIVIPFTVAHTVPNI